MSVDDVLIENYIYGFDHPWMLVLIYIIAILGMLILNILLVIVITYSTSGYIGEFLYPLLRFLVAWLVEKIFNATPDLLHPVTRSVRHVGCLYSTVASNLTLNLYLPMLLLDDGVDIYNWVHAAATKVDKSFYFAERLQCMFRPSLNSQFNNSISSTLVSGSALSLLRLSVVIDCIWFPLKKKLNGVWNKITKKQIEQINADPIQWNDSIEFDLGTKYGSLINIFTITVVVGTIQTPIMVYPISLTVLIIGYFVDKHDLIHTFRASTTNPVVHQTAIGFSFLPFFVTSVTLTLYNFWRNTKYGQVISMASTLVSYGSCVILFIFVCILIAYITWRHFFAEGKRGKKESLQTPV